MEIALIWAMASNGVIGRENGLPWRLPDDMRHFMKTTLGHPVIMGRRTFESMPGALPRRLNIVLTGKPGYGRDGILIARDLDEALAIARKNANPQAGRTAFVIGGSRVYQAALPLAHRLVVTFVDAEVQGDTRFPEVDWNLWLEVDSRTREADHEHAYRFRIANFVRKPG